MSTYPMKWESKKRRQYPDEACTAGPKSARQYFINLTSGL